VRRPHPGGRAGVTAALAALALVLVPASPAAAENPVLDAEGDADLVAALEEATEVQGVCYGYDLSVEDGDTGQWSGRYAASSLGEGTLPELGPQCPEGVVLLVAGIRYTSELSDAEDSAGWRLDSTLTQLDIGQVEALGPSSGDLLDDERSETALLNAVLALPGLAAERAGVPPVLLEPNTEPLPADAAPTGSPGSDWLREHGVLLAGCVLLVLAGLALLVSSSRRPGPRPGSRPGSRPGRRPVPF
jgi:hypothetical protein